MEQLDLEVIKKKKALTLYSFKFVSDISLNEKTYKDTLIPDGIHVAFILSNFQQTFHPRYKKLNKEYIKENAKPKNSRGRNAKDKKEKIKKKDNGTNEEFSSNITLGILQFKNNPIKQYDGLEPYDIYSMKVFRKRSGNIPSIPINDMSIVNSTMDSSIRYLTKSVPNINIKITELMLKLRNGEFYYDLIRGNNYRNPVINIHRLRKVLAPHSNTFPMILMGNKYNCSVYFNNTNPRLSGYVLISKKPKYIFRFTIDPKGRIYIFGGKDDEILMNIAKELFKKLDENRNYVIQNGLKTIITMELNEYKRLRRLGQL